MTSRIYKTGSQKTATYQCLRHYFIHENVTYDHYPMKNGILTINSNCDFYDWLTSAHPEASIQGRSPASFHM